ncbi:MAG: PQQ-binding-like beta-propeller repeat protein [Alphaproteobacteria bacterium]|mgnify:CR=1 FL=1|jgi:outer membrane protein assembly factor BamB|nr:pyrrolo-quinoline quinone [Rhodospirillaceae bacterium]MDP6406292.1 PQQ-binding-like beta-propeller repeat protein [Alphaproteobacteria bacterium]MDP6624064.1 PQQ-binding-like beta-propeller repeat protein [Alphaproteobacteria bacterium]
MASARLRLLPVAALAFALAALLAACDSMPEWLGSIEKPPLPGERISVIAMQRTLVPDPDIADLDVRLPKPYANADWPQDGGDPSHAMHHLAAGENVGELWRQDAGAGSDDLRRLLASPVVANGLVFVFDAEGRVSAFDAASGAARWSYSVVPKGEEEGAIGGGLAVESGILYIASGYGEVIALEAATGAEFWRHRIGVPLRGAPTVSAGRVFVISHDNQLWALSAIDGQLQWSHVGIAENAGLLGASSPAVQGDLVVAPYSSGELFALRVENGRIAWADALTRAGRMTALAELSDINGRPVIDRGRVYAVSHAGRMVAIDLRSGGRVWEQDIASVQSPWVAGDFLFVVTLEGQVVCLSRLDGRVRWVRQLARYEDEEEREPIRWSGPLLVGDRLVVTSSAGTAVAVSPYTGLVLGSLDMSVPVSIPPVVANGTLFFLTDDANLIAYR